MREIVGEKISDIALKHNINEVIQKESTIVIVNNDCDIQLVFIAIQLDQDEKYNISRKAIIQIGNKQRSCLYSFDIKREHDGYSDDFLLSGLGCELVVPYEHTETKYKSCSIKEYLESIFNNEELEELLVSLSTKTGTEADDRLVENHMKISYESHFKDTYIMKLTRRDKVSLFSVEYWENSYDDDVLKLDTIKEVKEATKTITIYEDK